MRICVLPGHKENRMDCMQSGKNMIKRARSLERRIS